MREIAEDTTRATMLDRDATTCQYLMAECFVKSILEYQCEMQEGIREIADVIMKRLMSLDGFADVKNGDRATQQLRLLADVIARWITEILDEVAETHKEVLKQYDKKRWMKRLEVIDDNKIKDKLENGKQIDQMKEKEIEEEANKEEQKEKESDEEKDKAEEKAREREQLDDREAKSESIKEETVKEEQENEEIKREEEEEEEEQEQSETEEK